MPVADIARPQSELVSARPETPLHEVALLMADNRVGCVVVERDGAPEGIVTDRDIALEVVAEQRDPAGLTAADVMTDDPVTANCEDGVFEVFETMREHGVRRMPVVERGELAGILTFDDLVVLLEDELRNLSEIVRTESPPYPTT